MVARRTGNEAPFAICNNNIGTSIIEKDFLIKAKANYSCYLYSLDLLLPVDMNVAKYYVPRSDYGIGWIYYVIHSCAGWMLVALFLAALTGLIK